MIELTRDGDVFVLRMDDGENRFTPGALDGFGANLALVEAAEGPKALVTVGTHQTGGETRTALPPARSRTR